MAKSVSFPAFCKMFGAPAVRDYQVNGGFKTIVCTNPETGDETFINAPKPESASALQCVNFKGTTAEIAKQVAANVGKLRVMCGNVGADEVNGAPTYTLVDTQFAADVAIDITF